MFYVYIEYDDKIKSLGDARSKVLSISKRICLFSIHASGHHVHNV